MPVPLSQPAHAASPPVGFLQSTVSRACPITPTRAWRCRTAPGGVLAGSRGAATPRRLRPCLSHSDTRQSHARVIGQTLAVEVERKFLVPDPPDLAATRADEIEQGYLAIGEDAEVRVRRKGERLVLTAKRGSGLSRQEAEIELDRERFDGLWPLTEGRRLHKRRHVVPHGDLKVEVDVYEGDLSGLVVAEIEFSSEEEAREFDPPEWLGEEVTGDHRYLNETLATDGAP